MSEEDWKGNERDSSVFVCVGGGRGVEGGAVKGEGTAGGGGGLSEKYRSKERKENLAFYAQVTRTVIFRRETKTKKYAA